MFGSWTIVTPAIPQIFMANIACKDLNISQIAQVKQLLELVYSICVYCVAFNGKLVC